MGPHQERTPCTHMAAELGEATWVHKASFRLSGLPFHGDQSQDTCQSPPSFQGTDV